jgi:hypothetical protein
VFQSYVIHVLKASDSVEAPPLLVSDWLLKLLSPCCHRAFVGECLNPMQGDRQLTAAKSAGCRNYADHSTQGGTVQQESSQGDQIVCHLPGHSIRSCLAVRQCGCRNDRTESDKHLGFSSSSGESVGEEEKPDSDVHQLLQTQMRVCPLSLVITIPQETPLSKCFRE